jgi:hypothetical protein
MVARTVKFMGSAYSTGSTISLEVEYNNNIVYSGTLPAVTQDPLPGNKPDTSPDWAQELFTFMTDTDITGEIPMRITVTNGVVYFGHFWMNYCGNCVYEPNPANPSQYIKVPVPPVDFYADPNTNTEASDGISNTMKNGEPWNWRVNVGSLLGDWAYSIYESETFTADFYVDPAKIVLEPYIPPA